MHVWEEISLALSQRPRAWRWFSLSLLHERSLADRDDLGSGRLAWTFYQECCSYFHRWVSHFGLGMRVGMMIAVKKTDAKTTYPCFTNNRGFRIGFRRFRAVPSCLLVGCVWCSYFLRADRVVQFDVDAQNVRRRP